MIKLGGVIRVNCPVFQMVTGDQDSERLRCPDDPDSGVHKCSAPRRPAVGAQMAWRLRVWLGVGPADRVRGRQLF